MTTEYISLDQRAQVSAAIRKYGVGEAAKRLGISNESILRLAGDYGCQHGTEALAVQRLERLL